MALLAKAGLEKAEIKAWSAVSALLCVAAISFLISAAIYQPLNESIKAIDHGIMGFLSGYANKSIVFDQFVMWVLSLPTFKLLPMVACLCYLWFLKDPTGKARMGAALAVASAALSLLLGRLLQNWGPERPRPLHSGDPDFVAPYGVSNQALENWSSFPSDHACLTFAMASAVLYVSRPLGLFCMAWATFVVCLPRIYGGFHYFSDVAGGAIIGVAAFYVLYGFKAVSTKLLSCAEYFETRHRALFYALSFVMAYQIVTMFNDIRAPLDSLTRYLN